MKVERHSLGWNEQEITERLAASIGNDCEVAERVRELTSTWYWIAASGWRLVGLLSTRPDSELAAARPLLKRCARLFLADMQVRSGEVGEVEVRFEEDSAPVHFEARDHDTTTRPGTWLRAFYAAAVARDQYVLDALARFPMEVLLRTPMQADPWQEGLVRTLQAFHLRRDEAPTLLGAALEDTAPERAPQMPDLALRRGAPLMGMLLQLMLADEAAFNAELAHALEQHRVLAAEEPRDIDEFVARGPLALACIAHDMGLRVTVESPYIPRLLIEDASPIALCRPTGARETSVR